MIRKAIIFLLRMKLGVDEYEAFQFTTQSNNNVCFFTKDSLLRMNPHGYIRECHVGLNYLLSDKCEIKRVNFVGNALRKYAESLERELGDWWSEPEDEELGARIMVAAGKLDVAD